MSFYPAAPMVGLLCTGCRLALKKVPHDLLCKYNIPILATGETPFEGRGYKTGLMRSNFRVKSNTSIAFGYLTQIIRNPMWLFSPYHMMIQYREFNARYKGEYDKKIRKKNTLILKPFVTYIKWNENKLNYILKELKWNINPLSQSTWRGDCHIATLKNYLYKYFLGFNDKDDGYSDLIRDGQIDRTEALKRLEEENLILSENFFKTLKKMGLHDSKKMLKIIKR